MVHQNSTFISYPFFFLNCFQALVKDISQRNEAGKWRSKRKFKQNDMPKVTRNERRKTFYDVIDKTCVALE